MNSPIELNSVYSSWFRTMLVNALEKEQQKDGEDRVAVFLTLTFAKGVDRGEPGQAELDAFSHLYNKACRAIVGRNFHRTAARDQLPFVMAFLDCEGTRFRKELTFEGLHVHSVWLMSLSEIEPLKEVAGEFKGKGGAGSFAVVDKIDLQLIDTEDLTSVAAVCSYSSKMLGPNHLRLVLGEDFRVYPESPKAR